MKALTYMFLHFLAGAKGFNKLFSMWSVTEQARGTAICLIFYVPEVLVFMNLFVALFFVLSVDSIVKLVLWLFLMGLCSQFI